MNKFETMVTGTVNLDFFVHALVDAGYDVNIVTAGEFGLYKLSVNVEEAGSILSFN